ncbi:nuclear transport factor 2 family protein [Streptomonospora nanhaiensis]|uniref:nuclear transport factor 2 family protein n=1 Tax=Streptomonospora nanhaiensis TaxID=1323731 RepID=UPI0020CB50B1|nr:nuclear transport factor 2 family protein [Streptomonospora nanhaiensis]
MAEDWAPVREWHRAVNARDLDTARRIAAPGIRVGGPKGAAAGVEVFTDWITRSGIRLEPVSWHPVGADRVVVEQEATWPGAPDAQARQAPPVRTATLYHSRRRPRGGGPALRRWPARGPARGRRRLSRTRRRPASGPLRRLGLEHHLAQAGLQADQRPAAVVGAGGADAEGAAAAMSATSRLAVPRRVRNAATTLTEYGSGFCDHYGLLRLRASCSPSTKDFGHPVKVGWRRRTRAMIRSTCSSRG